jgi:hypothetical protein
MLKSRIRMLFLACLAVFLMLTGMSFVRLTTPFGLGLGNDAVAYIAGARSLLAGNGYRQIWLISQGPITHYPPLFSILIAGISLLGIEPLVAAHGLVTVLYGINGLLIGLIGRLASRSDVSFVLSMILFTSNSSLLEVHRHAMSEPLYLALSLAALLVFYTFFQTQKERWLVFTGFIISLTFLTRYVGLALWIAAFVALLLLERDLRLKLRHTVVLSVSVFPLALTWLVRNALLAGNLANRRLVWHPVSMEKIQEGVEKFWTWLVPGRIWNWISALDWMPLFLTLVLLGGGLLMIFQARKDFPDNLQPGEQIVPAKASSMLFMVLTYTYAYLALMLVSMSLFDAATIFENRILAPIFVSLLIWISSTCFWLWRKGKIFFRLLSIGLGFFYIGFFIVNQVRWINSVRFDSEGFASRLWLESPTLAAINKMPGDAILYTNEPTLVYIRTGRAVFVLPTPYDTALAMERPGYLQELQRVNQEVTSGEATMVFLALHMQEDAETLAWYQQLTQGLFRFAQYRDGEIYTAQP